MGEVEVGGGEEVWVVDEVGFGGGVLVVVWVVVVVGAGLSLLDPAQVIAPSRHSVPAATGCQMIGAL